MHKLSRLEHGWSQTSSVWGFSASWPFLQALSTQHTPNLLYMFYCRLRVSLLAAELEGQPVRPVGRPARQADAQWHVGLPFTLNWAGCGFKASGAGLELAAGPLRGVNNLGYCYVVVASVAQEESTVVRLKYQSFEGRPICHPSL